MVRADHLYTTYQGLARDGAQARADRLITNTIRDFASDSVYKRWYAKDNIGSPDR